MSTNLKVDILKETTIWDKVDFKVPNHTYAINQLTGKLVAYWKECDNEFVRFKKELPFTKTRRKFDKITHNEAKPYREQLI